MQHWGMPSDERCATKALGNPNNLYGLQPSGSPSWSGFIHFPYSFKAALGFAISTIQGCTLKLYLLCYSSTRHIPRSPFGNLPPPTVRSPTRTQLQRS